MLNVNWITAGIAPTGHLTPHQGSDLKYCFLLNLPVQLPLSDLSSTLYILSFCPILGQLHLFTYFISVSLAHKEKSVILQGGWEEPRAFVCLSIFHRERIHCHHNANIADILCER